MIAAERAFAARSVEKGMKDAFLSVLAPDAILFRPGPVAGVQWFQERPAAPGATLEWAPDLAAIANTEDLGYTSGPWQYIEGNDTAHGHFATVWRRMPDGAWKVAIDTGAAHTAVDLEITPVVPEWSDPRERDEERTHHLKRPTIGTKQDLVAADRELAANVAAQGWAKAFDACADAEVRVCRPGTLPADGKAAALKLLAARPGKAALEVVGGGVSAGDLGYTYGTGSFEPEGAAAGGTEYFGYLRVWRVLEDGKRVVVLDVASKMPAPKRTP